MPWCLCLREWLLQGTVVEKMQGEPAMWKPCGWCTISAAAPAMEGTHRWKPALGRRHICACMYEKQRWFGRHICVWGSFPFIKRACLSSVAQTLSQNLRGGFGSPNIKALWNILLWPVNSYQIGKGCLEKSINAALHWLLSGKPGGVRLECLCEGLYNK